MLRKLCSTGVALLCVSAFDFAHAKSVVTTATERKTPEIVLRASRYVDSFIQNFSNVVAEERYVQESVYPHRRRELLSDFLLVTPPGFCRRATSTAFATSSEASRSTAARTSDTSRSKSRPGRRSSGAAATIATSRRTAIS